MRAHEIEYKLYGDDMQFVEIELDPEESVIAEAGAMMMMEDYIEMETIFGDGSGPSGGLFGKLMGAGKRLVTGESMFMTVFTNTGHGKRHVSFAAPYPGKIIPVDLTEYQGKVVCQKMHFFVPQRRFYRNRVYEKIGTGFFGGEGFIMQKLEGDGLAFMHAGGTVYKRELKHGEKLRIDTGCLVAMTKDINYDVEFVGKVKQLYLAAKVYSSQR